jgi:hypothetical protein
MLTAFCFFDGIQYSMFIVSLWPYLNTVKNYFSILLIQHSNFLKIDPGAGAAFFGIITAGFSFGQAFGSPILGFWMNRVKSSSAKISLRNFYFVQSVSR